MNAMPTDKIAEKGVEFLETAIKLAQNETPKLVEEFLNYMIFLSALEIVKSLLYLILFAILLKSYNAYVAHVKNSVLESAPLKLGSNVRLDSETADDKISFDNAVFNHRVAIHTKKKDDEVALLKCVRLFVVAVYIVWNSYTLLSPVQRIGKIIIAPKVFLIEEGAKLFKPGKIDKE